MKIGGYQYDFTTCTVGIPGIPNERVGQEVSAISTDGGLSGREHYHGSGRDPSGINDGKRAPSGSLTMTQELLHDIIEAPYFAAGIDMAQPFNMSITVRANIAPFTSGVYVFEGVRLETPKMNWNNGDKALPVEVAYKCIKRTYNGKPV